MKITVHEFRISSGDAYTTFHCAAHRRHLTVREIADACRQDWQETDHTAGRQVPEDDAEVLRLYFKDKAEDDNKFATSYWIEESTYEIDLAPAGDVSLTGDGGTITVITDGDGGALLGSLVDGPAEDGECQAAIDTLESFILQLACAGFPVQAPEFQQCVTETLDRLADMDMLGGETGEDECA